MNIIRYELKSKIKLFTFWMLGLFAMIVMGMYKYDAFTGSDASLSDLMDSFPRIVKVIFGISELDIATLIGYYAILFLYLIIMIAIFAINLGVDSTAREINDQTADFIFSKPLSRSEILVRKYMAGIFYICLFSIFSYFFTLIGLSGIVISDNESRSIILFNIVLLMIGLIYYAIGALIGVLNHRRAGAMGIAIFLITFIAYIIYDLTGWFLLRIISPIKYFHLPEVVTNQNLSLVTLSASLTLFILLLIGATYLFKRKNID